MKTSSPSKAGIAGLLVTAMLGIVTTAQTPAQRPATQPAQQQPTSGTAVPQTQGPPQPPSTSIGALSRIRPKDPNYRLPEKQTFHYDVDWRLFRAGTATLRVEPAGSGYRVIGAADAAGAVALLYHVRDRFESMIDPTTWCSQSLSKSTEEGFRRVQTNIRFDYMLRKALLDERNLRKNTSKQQESDIPACVTDVLAGIFYVGSLPLAPGQTYYLPLNDGGKTADVKATVEGREQLTVPAGTFNAIRVQPEAASGPVKDRGSMWVWYDESGRFPVQMRARMFWGTLTFRLSRIER